MPLWQRTMTTVYWRDLTVAAPICSGRSSGLLDLDRFEAFDAVATSCHATDNPIIRKFGIVPTNSFPTSLSQSEVWLSRYLRISDGSSLQR